jgi:hypothetical protein
VPRVCNRARFCQADCKKTQSFKFGWLIFAAKRTLRFNGAVQCWLFEYKLFEGD